MHSEQGEWMLDQTPSKAEQLYGRRGCLPILPSVSEPPHRIYTQGELIYRFSPTATIFPGQRLASIVVHEMLV